MCVSSYCYCFNMPEFVNFVIAKNHSAAAALKSTAETDIDIVEITVRVGNAVASDDARRHIGDTCLRATPTTNTTLVCVGDPKIVRPARKNKKFGGWM